MPLIIWYPKIFYVPKKVFFRQVDIVILLSLDLKIVSKKWNLFESLDCLSNFDNIVSGFWLKSGLLQLDLKCISCLR